MITSRMVTGSGGSPEIYAIPRKVSWEAGNVDIAVSLSLFSLAARSAFVLSVEHQSHRDRLTMNPSLRSEIVTDALGAPLLKT
jgi:hypothetical protein